MAEDIRVGDRVRGALSGRTGRVVGGGTTHGNLHVEWDSGISPGRNIRPGSLERIDPSPLAILARAAEEVLTYHVPAETEDHGGVDGCSGAVSVADLRFLVRKARNEGMI